MDIETGKVSPRPFSEIPGLWLKVFQMDEAFFTAEAPRASNGNTLLALLIYAVASVIFAFIQRQIGASQVLLEKYFGNTPNVDTPIYVPFIALVAVPLGFYIGMGLFHLGALIFNGKGSFTTLAYLVSLFGVPLNIAAAVLSLIPCLGALLSLALTVFVIVLTVRAIKVNYQLTTGKAAWAYFVPTVVILVIVLPVCVIGTLALMGPSIGTIFSNVIQGLGTPVP